MPTYPFIQIDTFTRTPLRGNPCAVVFDADSFSADTMLDIAREMNLSETAFVLRSQTADARARYFTPAEEIPFAGHPTIATVHALVETGRLLLSGSHTRMALELKVGPVPVDIYSADSSEAEYVMTQKKPQFLVRTDPSETARVFGLRTADLAAETPPQVVSACPKKI